MVQSPSAPFKLPPEVCKYFFKPHVLQAKELFIVQRHRSFIGLPQRFKESCITLGLLRRLQTHFIVPTTQNIGKLVEIKNLVKIRYIKNGPFPPNLLAQWSGYRNLPTFKGYIIEKTSPYCSKFVS